MISYKPKQATFANSALLCVLVLLATALTKAKAADAVHFNGSDSYAQIPAWQPSGGYKVVAWLGELNPTASAKNVLLSNSRNGEYLAYYHKSVQAQFGQDHLEIWSKFDFQETKYIEIEVQHGKMTVSDGVRSASIVNKAINPNNASFDLLFKRNGKYYQGTLEAIAMLDLANPSNSRAYGFDRNQGLVEVGASASLDALVNVNEDDWRDSHHDIDNPDPDHFQQTQWDQLFNPSASLPAPPQSTPVSTPVEPALASHGVSFDGNNNYGEISPWQPHGRFKVIAYMAELDADSSARTILLSSSSTGEFLGFSHRNVQGRWGNEYPGIWGAFDFASSQYVEITVDHGEMSATDGSASATVKDKAIDPTKLAYNWLFRRGYSDYSKGTLQALILIDYEQPSNSRAYAFNQEQGMVEVNGDDNGTIHNLEAQDWIPLGSNIANPDPTVFNDASWQAIYGGGDNDIAPPPPQQPVDPPQSPQQPLPQPTQLLSATAKAIRFDGNNDYLEFDDWQPQGDYRAVAWLEEINNDSNALTYLISASNGNYLAFNHHTVEGKWGGSVIRLENQFAFNNTHYVEISVEDGKLTASDGQTTASTKHSAIRATNTRFEYAFRSGNKYSKGALQTLGLIDYSSIDNVRGYSFNNQQQIVESAEDPSNRNYLRGVANSSWIKINTKVLAPTPLLNSQAEWDAQFESHYPGRRPMTHTTDGNDKRKFAWEAHYWLRAYLTMAKTYNDDKYLDYAIELIDHIFNYTDAKRVQRGELKLNKQPYNLAPKHYLNQRGTPAPGWRRPFGGWRIEVLSDGQILNAITRVADYIKSNNKTRFVAKADQYLRDAQAIIRSHDSSYSTTKHGAVQGSYYYPNDNNREFGDRGLFSNPVPFNHSMTLGVAMIYVAKWLDDDEMSQRVEQINGFFDDHMLYLSDGTCSWNYAFDKNGNNKLEDVNHGHLDVGFIAVSHQEQIRDNERMLRCFTKTLTDKIFIAPGMISRDVEGNRLSSEWDMVAIGYDWDELTRYDSRVAEINKHVLRQYGQPDWYRPYLAWAKQLYWQQFSN